MLSRDALNHLNDDLDGIINDYLISEFKTIFLGLEYRKNPSESLLLLPGFFLPVEKFMYRIATGLGSTVCFSVGRYDQLLDSVANARPHAFRDYFSDISLKIELSPNRKENLEVFVLGLDFDHWYRFIYGIRCSFIHAVPVTLLSGALALPFRNCIRCKLQELQKGNNSSAKKFSRCCLFLLNLMENEICETERSMGYPRRFHKNLSDSLQASMCNEAARIWYPMLAKTLMKQLFEWVIIEHSNLFLV